ncbi:DUF4910 domain-containing protein [Streptomyces sp. NPDC053079]|uniref:DUF4910 domain-containing protein n=1 Tax=Streptomyces sp. NPDC053079 TaxID=3365697 RepID=UPI0037D3AF59
MGELRRLTAGLWEEFDHRRTMDLVRRLITFDRYQASAGVHAAAETVAAAAEASGLTEVEVTCLPADGAPRWWTFAAPLGWTPLLATLGAADESAVRPLLRYPEQQPYGLAAYSASTPPQGVAVPLVRLPDEPPETWPDRALVLLDGMPGPAVLPALLRHGACGFVVGNRGPVRRIELPLGSPLFAFSVTGAVFDELDRLRRSGRRALAVVRVDARPDTMPVVTGRTPGGDGSGQHALVTAHLCHPSPGANDNASGVCTALEVGRLLAARAPRRPVRFLWAPEIVGTAAYLHTVRERLGAPLPFAAVNLDMTGEDQRLCGGPLIVEGGPQHLPSCLTAVVEECVRALPAAARSFSGAVGCDTWAWRATPFTGGSDHGLLCDRSIGCPSVQLGHWPDRFHHSDADGIDKVDPQELRRSGTVAAAALAVLCEADDAGGGPLRPAELAATVARWGARYMTGRLPAPGAPWHSRPGWVDPLAGEYAERAVRRAAESVTGALYSLRERGAGAEAAPWVRRTAAVAAALAQLAGDGPAHAPPPPDPDRWVPERTWAGPFNLRALLGDALPEDRAWFLERMAEDERGWYARAMALAQGLDGATDARQVVERAALDSLLPFEAGSAERFLTLMRRARWST